MTDTPYDRLHELGVDLARAFHEPKGAYVNVLSVGSLVYVSGHGPLLDGKPAYVGRVPTEVSVDEAREAARLTMLNCLATLDRHLGSLDRIAGFVKVLGMVRAEPDFGEHPRVIDGASELLVDVFGERGAHTRSAVGMQSLPFGIPVEIELTASVEPGDRPAPR